jgi:alpha,alpha-trehalase
MKALHLSAAAALAASLACGTPAAAPHHPYDPAHDLGGLFQDVELSRVFPDSKTFVDARPLLSPAQVASRYATERVTPGFSLTAFVARYFQAPRAAAVASPDSGKREGMEDHIRSLWPMLARPPDSADARSTLIPLPKPYVVPGGRFREVYYWDSYFTMLGLVASGRTDLVRDMLDNFAYLIETFGHIPNGTRSYYLSRSQPPFFAAMVALYASATDTAQALPYLDALEAEYAFWMDGADGLAPGAAHARVVRLADGALLNRYWDDLAEPRPESYREDYEAAQALPAERRPGFYRNIRATAESGWDFSSRWMRDPRNLRTLETTQLIPVDLNSLLYCAERTIARLRAFRGRPEDAAAARRFAAAAERRRAALLRVAYDPAGGFFFDVRWPSGARATGRPTLAAAVPLYFGLATADQGRAVARRLERQFLKPGGFVTTLVASGQQWDAPNGWPPLQWMAIEGVRRYGRADLADDGARRWLRLNRRTYAATGKMTEKYDVVDLARRAGGGEYPTQDGFGWTNGVVLGLESGLWSRVRTLDATPRVSTQVRRAHGPAAAGAGP